MEEKKKRKGQPQLEDRTIIKNGYVDNSPAKIHQNNDMSVG
jgi:hypothetical protein